MKLEPVYPEAIKKHLLEAYNLPDKNIALMLEVAKKSLNENIALVESSLNDNTIDSTLHAAHSLKGVLLNLGQKKFARVAAKIEKEAETGNISESTFNHIKELRDGLTLLL